MEKIGIEEENAAVGYLCLCACNCGECSPCWVPIFRAGVEAPVKQSTYEGGVALQ